MKHNTKTTGWTRMSKAFLGGMIFSICFTVTLNAQNVTSAQKKEFKKNFKQGNISIQNGSLNSTDEHIADTTLKYFLRCYAIDSNNANVAYIIGKMYLSTAMHKAAALPYLEKAVKNIKRKYHPNSVTETHAPPMAYYFLARAQHVNYQFGDAIDNFNIFKRMLKPTDPRPKDIDYWIACCNNAMELVRSPVDCKVINMGGTVNSVYDDYAPVITADESEMYFTSKRPLAEDTAHDREGIWVTTAGVGKVWGTPQDPGAPLNVMGGNSATVSLTPDGQMMIIYKSQSVNNGILYMSKMTGDEWQTPTVIDTGDAGAVDAKHSGYFTPSACLSPDGKSLYFSSNRPGGFGGLDLYESDMQTDGTWGSATNLGSTINTAYDEDCPFVSYDGSLLFFSSKGHNTMGGYDVFMSKGGQGAWGEPQNLGYPVNTPDDDKYFVLSPDGRRGYYNTVRLGSMGERDIYQVTFNSPLPVECVGILVGYLKTPDGSPIPSDAKVTCSVGNTSSTVMVNTKTGKFLAILKASEKYSIVITAGGKQMNKYDYTVPIDSSYCTVSRSFLNKKVTLGDTANIFLSPPVPVPVAALSKFSTTPYFEKYFGYNMDEVSDKDPDFGTLVSNINELSKDSKIVVSIESSASEVPTTKFGSNANLARARAESLKRAIHPLLKNMENIRFELKSGVNGPEYAKDPQDHAKYEKFQYVKANIREAGGNDLSLPVELPAGTPGQYTIVVGSYSTKEHADNLISKFEKKNVYLSIIGKNSHGAYMVGYGNFKSHEEAATEQASFRKKYKIMNTWIKSN